MSATERFLRYVVIDTQSDPESGRHPSSERQFRLARLLLSELNAMGLDARLDEHCYLYAKIPANAPAPAIGFIAHMDTEPVVSGKDVTPRIVRYEGGDIPLSDSVTLRASEFPALEAYRGQELIVTDGRTLLGADDKAGVAEIMEFAAYLLAHPECKHGPIGIAFTPDEEIGEGADFFDVPGFGCDFAYTVDGGPIGEISYETFNAAAAVFTLKGRNIHPGAAKGKMVNCSLIAGDLLSRFPADETPATTEGRQGFYHIESVETGVEMGKIKLILRDHDRKAFEARKAFVASLADALCARYGNGSVSVNIVDSYYNCGERIAPHFHLIETAQRAIRKAGAEPFLLPVRGGTDGARLSFLGLPCPNLGTGGHNCHSVFEFIAVPSLERGVSVLRYIAEAYAEQNDFFSQNSAKISAL